MKSESEIRELLQLYEESKPLYADCKEYLLRLKAKIRVLEWVLGDKNGH